MKMLMIVSWVALLLYMAGADSLMTVLGPVWFLGLGAAILGAMLVSSRQR